MVWRLNVKIVGIGAILVGLAGLTGCSKYMQKRAERLWQSTLQEHRTFDVGIVPGYPFNGEHWDRIMESRVRWASYLYKKGIVRHLIFSGAAVHSPYVEAQVMGIYAEQLGVPRNRIFFETKAEHSTENIYYSYLLAGKQGFKSIALLTDPYQSALLARFTRKRFATPIAHLPFIEDTLRKMNTGIGPIDASSAYVQTFTPLKERKSFSKRTRGTLGRNIKWGALDRLPAL